jgi:hypothetical protein
MAIVSSSGLFGSTYSFIDGRMPMRSQTRRMVLKNGNRVLRELFDTLIGAAAGDAASKTYPRIAEDSGMGGGRRTIDTVTVISRVSTSADITTLKEIVVNVDRSAAYPADLSGNGGPALA